MSKYCWTVTIKGQNPKVLHHYKHLTRLYYFIRRNPKIFKYKKITIYNHHLPIVDTTYNKIIKRIDVGLLEGEERKFLLKFSREYSYLKLNPHQKIKI